MKVLIMKTVKKVLLKMILFITFIYLQEFSIMIKWPNDIYYGKEAKLGGIIATSFTLGQDTTAVIGMGEKSVLVLYYYTCT